MSKKSSVRGYYSTRTTKLTTLRSKHSQSALEYMMTYGWAILIIVIVAAGLYSLGIFSPTNSASTSITGFNGLGSVQAACSPGGLEMQLGNNVGYSINITGINVSQGSVQTSLMFPSYKSDKNNYIISPNGQKDFILLGACPNSTSKFSVSISISYTEPGRTFSGPYQTTGTVYTTSVPQYNLYGPDLIGYWPMNEGAGTTVFDLSGNGNVGTSYNSPAWTNGKFGYAVNLSAGSKQYVSVPYNSILQPVQITLSAWVYETNGSSQDIVHDGPAGYGALDYDMVTNYLDFHLSSGYYTLAFTNINLNSWNNVACTISYVGTSTTATCYVNGVQVATNTFSGSGIYYQYSNNIEMGRGYTGGAQYLNGKIEDVRIYNTSLSAQAISALYQSNILNFEH